MGALEGVVLVGVIAAIARVEQGLQAKAEVAKRTEEWIAYLRDEVPQFVHPA